MGNHISQSQCVSLEDSTLYIEPSYTVKRTSGEMESGWVISKPKVMGTSFPPWINQHATKQNPEEQWRIFMNNNSDNPNTYICGWRRLETIYPSNLEGDTEAIRVWRYDFLKHLEILEELRLNDQKEEKKSPLNLAV